MQSVSKSHPDDFIHPELPGHRETRDDENNNQQKTNPCA